MNNVSSFLNYILDYSEINAAKVEDGIVKCYMKNGNVVDFTVPMEHNFDDYMLSRNNTTRWLKTAYKKEINQAKKHERKRKTD